MNKARLIRRLKRLMHELAETERALQHYVEPPKTAATVRRAAERMPKRRKPAVR